MSQIDPQEFGEMRANVRSLLASDEKRTELLEGMSRSISAIQLQLAEAKGGWKLFIGLGGAAASFGGVVAWIIHEFVKR